VRGQWHSAVSRQAPCSSCSCWQTETHPFPSFFFLIPFKNSKISKNRSYSSWYILQLFL
jgi:hypothetical protein